MRFVMAARWCGGAVDRGHRTVVTDGSVDVDGGRGQSCLVLWQANKYRMISNAFSFSTYLSNHCSTQSITCTITNYNILKGSQSYTRHLSYLDVNSRPRHKLDMTVDATVDANSRWWTRVWT